MAIYIPTLLSPKNETRDMSQSQIFSAQLNGTQITHYQIIIKKNSDNTQVYDSTKITLSTSLYDKDTLSHTIPGNTIPNNIEYKWILTVWENTTNVSSAEIFFKAFSTPTLTLVNITTLNSQEYEPVATYTHPQGIPIKKFKFVLYDDQLNIIQETPYKFSGNIRYKFDGFINTKTYSIRAFAEDQNNIKIQSNLITFTVSYSPPSIDIVPSAEVLNNKAAVKLKWNHAVQIEGAITGTVTYVDNFITEGNKAANIHSGSSIEFTVAVPLDFSCMFTVNPTEGIICHLDSNYKIGYIQNRFYFDNNGIIEYSNAITSPENLFRITIRPTNIFVEAIDMSASWGSFDMPWDQIDMTFEEMSSSQYD